MARQFGALIFAGAILAAAHAQEPAPGGSPFPGGPRRLLEGPGFEKAREAFKNMSPEERQKWMENFRRWQQLPPERRQALLNREEFQRTKMREEIESALKASGLQLNDEQRKQFEARYGEERRKIEEDVRRQMEEARRPRVQALVEKLKQEFAAAAGK